MVSGSLGDRAGISQDSVVCEGVKATGGDGNPPPDLKQPVVGAGPMGKTGEVPAGTTELLYAAPSSSSESSSVEAAAVVGAGGNWKAKADVARAAPVPAAIMPAVLLLGDVAGAGVGAAAAGTVAEAAFTAAGAGGGGGGR